MQPSVNCWIPKIKGMTANSFCDGLRTFITVATPIAEITAPAVKLAPAEKHIILLFSDLR
jgi:hypothetical protein